MLGRLTTAAVLLGLSLTWSGHAMGAATPEQLARTVVPRMERVAACSWDRPGHNPFMGDVVASIDRYVDIPTLVRIRLKERMRQHRYDDLVSIRRDSIEGKRSYEPQIRDMHFGWDRVCSQVSRAGWGDAMRERGLVYCDSGHCILVPTVCRNVSRITPRPDAVSDAREAAGATDPARQGAEPSDMAPVVVATPITSSFAEAVADANVPLWPGTEAPPTGDGGTLFPPFAGGLPDDPGGAGAMPGPAWPGGPSGGGGGAGGPGASDPGAGGDPVQDGGPIFGGGPGGGGGGGDSDEDGGGPPGGGGGGFPGGGGGGWTGGGNLPPGGGGGAVSPIPEPATWAHLVVGLIALAGVTMRRRQARGTASCITQKRS
ncbi:MAG TPA: MHFG family PEP-CTERM protein [Burkholderiaceae bacterium]|nr:MHFG family PEP-CTERM protein [Burkholderiaceae bacterium]